MDLEEIMRKMELAEYSYYDYHGMVMNSVFPAATLDRIKETAFHDEDIILATYPKSGTTWMQEIINLVLNNGKSSDMPIYVRHTFIERQLPGLPAEFDKWTSGDHSHIIKTHLGAKFFEKTIHEKKTKFIVVFRNPKDTLVSYYHFYKMNKIYKYKGTWKEFFQLFKEKKISHGDYFEMQLSWWKLRDNPRLLIVKYEDMLKSPEDAIRQVAKHLRKSLSDEVVQKIAKMTSFESMKVNPLLNYTGIPVMKTEISPFMRKGKVGDWKNYFSKEQSDYVDKMTDKYLRPAELFLEEN